MAIASPFPYSKGAVIADILSGVEVYVGIYGTCARKPNGGLLYRARAEVKPAKNGKVELVVPPLPTTESFTVSNVRVTTKPNPLNSGNSIEVELMTMNSMTVSVGETLYLQPINITIT